MDLPVRVLPCSRLPAVAMTGRGTELSRNGMALHAGVDIELDDLLEVEFLIPHPLKVLATVRSRSGCYFGLQFLAMRTCQWCCSADSRRILGGPPIAFDRLTAPNLDPTIMSMTLPSRRPSPRVSCKIIELR